MKALVTGGTGFVGSHLVQTLVEAGHSARVLHRASSKLDALAGLTYESVVGDLTDADALRAACAGCDWVFHVAAVADYWRADVSKMFEANVDGTRAVLQAAREADVQRVVFTSSAAAVGLRDNGTTSDEGDAFNLPPERFPYGYSKSLAEGVVMEAVSKGQNVVIVNPVVIMGPGDLNMISGNFVTRIATLGRFAPVTTGGVAVTDVRDVARWHLAAAERGRAGERYILGTANYAYPQWLGMIADAVGVPRPLVTVPNVLLSPIAAMIDLARKVGISTPVDANQTRLSGRRIFFDFAKAWRELGAPEISMQQSLDDSYRWYVEHGFLHA